MPPFALRRVELVINVARRGRGCGVRRQIKCRCVRRGCVVAEIRRRNSRRQWHGSGARGVNNDDGIGVGTDDENLIGERVDGDILQFIAAG